MLKIQLLPCSAINTQGLGVCWILSPVLKKNLHAGDHPCSLKAFTQFSQVGGTVDPKQVPDTLAPLPAEGTICNCIS